MIFLAILPLLCFTCLSLNPNFMTHKFHFSSFFQGLGLLKRGNLLRKEAQQLEIEGLGKVEVVVAGSEVEGFYQLLRGAMSHPSMSFDPFPPKRTHPTLTTTISHPPPWTCKSAIP